MQSQHDGASADDIPANAHQSLTESGALRHSATNFSTPNRSTREQVDAEQSVQHKRLKKSERTFASLNSESSILSEPEDEPPVRKLGKRGPNAHPEDTADTERPSRRLV